MKYNPFQPNGVVAPGMFHGRGNELSSIEQCLFQTKNGNPQHFLIQGERGIGKTSLFLYVTTIASGQIATLTDVKLSFLTISIDLGGVQTQLEIVRSIARELKQIIAARTWLKEKASKVWDFLSNWEVLGVRYHAAAQETAPEDARDELVNNITGLWEGISADFDGVLILIDEADSPGEGADLGSFLKLFTERLTRKGCNNVVVGVAGLPSLIGQLRASHESSPRLFETMLLDPLEISERKRVIESGLAAAKEKNGFETKITEEALHLISVLSEGYPHFVQQFAYCAFAEDNDNTIDASDVTIGAFKENGALMQLGNKFFSEMYHARISSQDYRKVLDAMAPEGDQWIARQKIIATSGVSEANVTNALASLKTKKIILQDETRRGFYRLPTKSFAAWINAIRATTAKKDEANGELFP